MDRIAEHAAARPDDLAFVEPGRTLTWRETLEQRDRIATALAGLGVRPGDRVVNHGRNSLTYCQISQAVNRLGGVSVPMNRMLVGDEIAYIVEHAEAKVVVVDGTYLPVLEAVREGITTVDHWVITGDERRDWAHALDELVARLDGPLPDLEADPGTGRAMVYTSGTTGRPKGALRPASDPAVSLGWMQAFDLLDPTHVHLVAGPLYHSAPAAFAGFTTLVGGTVVVMPRFDPEEALRAIEAHRVTTTFMAPTLIKRLVDLPAEVRERYDTSSLRVLITGAAPCPQPLKERIVEVFGDVLYEFYGSSELGLNTVLRPEEVLRKPGSCGRATPGVELAVLDDDGRPLPAGVEGELHVRRFTGMFEGYHRDDTATRAASKGDWVSVGDVARIDDEGFVTICDRRSDMIVSAGVNIYPAEIEEALHRMPEVDDVAVFGVPDDDYGERVHASIALRPGASVTEQDVQTFARQHLAGFKIPRQVVFAPSLPRTPTGKLLKRELRAPYWESHGRRI